MLKELEELLNRYSLENGSDTPDFILAEYLWDCLGTYNKATKARDKWHNFKPFENATTTATQVNRKELI